MSSINTPYNIFRKLLSAIFFYIIAISVSAQIDTKIYQDTRVRSTRQKILIDTTPKRRVPVSDKIRVDENLHHVFTGAADTVWDLTPYLQSKASCDFQKTLNDDGCIIVTYSDGFIKKVCDGAVIEVTLPTGKKYVRRLGQTIKQQVIKMPPPPNPTSNETAYNWLTLYNEGLLSDIKKYLVSPQSINKYMQTENTVCKGSFYKEIEYRTIFLQEFLKAK